MISFASNKYQKDICTDLVDVVSMNPCPKWYNSTYDRVSAIDHIKPVLQPLFANMPKDKLFLITELEAEAIYGFRDPLKTSWSEKVRAFGGSLPLCTGE